VLPHLRASVVEAVRDVEADPAAFLIGLSRARVRWLLIGRQALIHYGAPVQTMDYDLWVDPVPANVRKFLRVARELGLEAPETAKELESRPLFSLIGGTLKIDVFKARKFTNLDGETIDFSSAYRRRVIARVKGDPLAPPLPSIRDLKTLKRMRDGVSDREDLRFLDLLEKQRPSRKK
jgi:hypothetical protein